MLCGGDSFPEAVMDQIAEVFSATKQSPQSVARLIHEGWQCHPQFFNKENTIHHDFSSSQLQEFSELLLENSSFFGHERHFQENVPPDTHFTPSLPSFLILT